MKKITGHQGDVQFKTIETIPTNAKKIKNLPLAYGEVSGHVHVLTGDIEMYEDNDRKFALVKGDGARIQHVYEKILKRGCLTQTEELPIADHSSILLPPGSYEFGVQKKYNPFEKTFERVVD
jgi:hypothetical protein